MNVRIKRTKLLLLATLFAAGLGFGVAHADRPYAEGCLPKAGCDFGGYEFGCCDPE
ncbi:hypothetical protein [Lysobacter sp. Root690]|uniref:hypothetical protein n=1 Tax=Lysobacter sp. Root690 TaxID=1736588 RepID=UPI000A7D4F20|nr:hypothetical protein [Lysobacter sp. Root690]